MRTRDLQRLIHGLSLDEKRALKRLLVDSISKDETEARRRAEPSKHARIDSKADNRTYRLESVRCGKEGCRCNDGKLHGPYWYAYWSENGVTRSEYVGKKPPRQGEKGQSVKGGSKR